MLRPRQASGRRCGDERMDGVKPGELRKKALAVMIGAPPRGSSR
jgi:hypothetical protein